MSTDIDINKPHIESIDVVTTVKENGSLCEKIFESGLDTNDASSATLPLLSDSELLPEKSQLDFQEDQDELDNRSNISSENEQQGSSSLSSPVSLSAEGNNSIDFLTFDLLSLQKHDVNEDFTKDDNAVIKNSTNDAFTINVAQNVPSCEQTDLNASNRNLTTSTISLDEQKSSTYIICKSPYSRSAENISTIGQFDDKNLLNASDKELNTEKILSQFTSQKNKVSATQKIPDNTSTNLDIRYTRIPKEILSQDIGSIVKNVHGIFSSVSGSLKYAYNQRSVQKPVKNVIKTIPNGKLMNDIFEDEHYAMNVTNVEKTNECLESNPILNLNSECIKADEECSKQGSDPKKDVFKLQIESLERLLFEQRKENATLRERVKQQGDELQEKDQTFKDLENKLDSMSKRVEQAQREKDYHYFHHATLIGL